MNVGHGGNILEIKRKYGIDNILDFSANINPIGISEKVKNAMILALEDISHYPDINYFDLIKSISDFESVDKNKIILGNGAAEVIFNAVRGLKPKKALLFAPTFSEYEEALESVDCKIEHYILKNKYDLDNGFIEKIKNDIDIIFICNPNNPTGALFSQETIIKILNKANENNCTVILDESFLEFIKDSRKLSGIEKIDDFKNLIVIKSLTKLFAFPGIRLGYGITSNEKYLSNIRKSSVAWNVNTLANAAGIEALKDSLYIEKSINYIKDENEFLYNKLKNFKDLEVFKGNVNFIFFKLNKDLDLKDELIRRGILIRSCSNYIGLDSKYYRIAVRTHEENERLINELDKIIK